MCVYIYIHIHTYICIYIYIYIKEVTRHGKLHLANNFIERFKMSISMKFQEKFRQNIMEIIKLINILRFYLIYLKVFNSFLIF